MFPFPLRSLLPLAIPRQIIATGRRDVRWEVGSRMRTEWAWLTGVWSRYGRMDELDCTGNGMQHGNAMDGWLLFLSSCCRCCISGVAYTKNQKFMILWLNYRTYSTSSLSPSPQLSQSHTIVPHKSLAILSQSLCANPKILTRRPADRNSLIILNNSISHPYLR